jgi:two-component system heavy metal sensor histidine kinase CusS
MKSIGSRIALWYAITATTTLACLFVAGYFLLQGHLIRQLDALNETQFKRLEFTLGPDHKTLTPEIIDDRIREVTESASSLFYIDMHGPMTNRFFRSNNLRGESIPDLPGERAYTVDVPGIGELRVSEFLLPPFEVTVATPMGPVRDVMAGYRSVFLVLLGVMLIVSVAIGYALGQLMLRPVRVIQATANRIRSDNLNERIPVGDVKDEMSQLARFLNQMFDRLETSFAEIRRFTADASHELKTPLSLVRLHAERLLVNGNLDPAQRESMQVQLEELARVNQIIDELLFLSRADARAITVDLNEQGPAGFLRSFAQDASALAEHHGQKFSYTHEGEGTVAFEDKRMRQVLLNLVVNALNASPSEGRITQHSTLADGVWSVRVEEEGPGLTPDQRERIFERFVRFTTPSGADKGSGLGLAISRSIVQLHRGRIFAMSGKEDRGLRMVIEIPARGSPGATQTQETVTAHA